MIVHNNTAQNSSNDLRSYLITAQMWSKCNAEPGQVCWQAEQRWSRSSLDTLLTQTCRGKLSSLDLGRRRSHSRPYKTVHITSVALLWCEITATCNISQTHPPITCKQFACRRFSGQQSIWLHETPARHFISTLVFIPTEWHLIQRSSSFAYSCTNFTYQNHHHRHH